MSDRAPTTATPTVLPGSAEELVEAYRCAEVDGDIGELDRLLSTDFVGVGPRGWLRDRDQWIDRHASGAVVTTRLELTGIAIRAHGDAALVVAEQHQAGRNGEHDTSGRFRLTLTALRHDGGWRVGGLHVGPLLD